MNVLLVTQYFHPENFKSNDVAFELARKGHEVTVLTSIPDYPQGKFHDGYGVFRRRREVVEGVTVWRTLVIPRGRGGGVRLAMNYLSWAFIASVWAFFMALFHRYDAVIVHQTSPVTQGFPALVVRMLRRCPIYFWVLDLWPESLQAAGGIRNRHVLGFFSWITALMYRHAFKILISSKGFGKSVLEKGDFAGKLVYFPNWAEDVFADPPVPSPEQIAELDRLPDGFRVMFTGNIGEAQDFVHVMEAAKLLHAHTNIKFILIGDGRRRRWVLDYISENGLEDTVYCPGRYPLEMMPAFCSRADVLFLALKDDFIFSLTAPAKLQSYMAMGKPVAAMINGETQKMISEAGCGLTVSAGDSKAFAAAVLELSSREDLAEMGESGYRYFLEHFRKDRCLSRLTDLLENQDSVPKRQTL